MCANMISFDCSVPTYSKGQWHPAWYEDSKKDFSLLHYNWLPWLSKPLYLACNLQVTLDLQSYSIQKISLRRYELWTKHVSYTLSLFFCLFSASTFTTPLLILSVVQIGKEQQCVVYKFLKQLVFFRVRHKIWLNIFNKKVFLVFLGLCS